MRGFGHEHQERESLECGKCGRPRPIGERGPAGFECNPSGWEYVMVMSGPHPVYRWECPECLSEATSTLDALGLLGAGDPKEDDYGKRRVKVPPKSDFRRGYETAQAELAKNPNTNFYNPFPKRTDAFDGYEQAVYDLRQKCQLP
jgi:hypothetical protein